MKILSVGAQLFDVDGQTDMTKLMFALYNFANASENSTWCRRCVFMFCMDLRTAATLPYTILTARFSYNQGTVFTVRYALSPFIQQMRVIFKG